MGPQQPRHRRAARRRRQGADRPGGRPVGWGGPLEGGPHCALGGRLGGRKRDIPCAELPSSSALWNSLSCHFSGDRTADATILTVPGCRRSLVSRAAPPSAPPPCPRTPVSSATQRPLGGSLRELPGSSTSFSASSLGRLQTLLILTTMSEKDSRPSTTSGGRHCMHGDGPGMPVGVGDEELFYSPTSGLPPAGGANGSAARGGTPHVE